MVVVGAGFAGLAAVRAIPDLPEFQVTLVDRRNHHLFQALLYQVASAGLNPSEIASPVRSLFRHRKNVSVLMAEMSGLRVEERVAEFDGGALTLPYDTLVLAVGGTTSYFGNDTWQEHSFGLKSLEEALAIRERVLLAFEEAEKVADKERQKLLMTIVVIGGGPTGVELSGAFAELKNQVLKWDFRRIDSSQARVVLLEAGPRLLSAFPESLSVAAQTDLRALGVELRLGERVMDIGPGFVQTDKARIDAQTIVWAGGVAGHPVAKALGFATNPKGQLKVDECLKVSADIYCLGDMAECTNPDDGVVLPAMAPVAMQQGEYCGRSLVATARGQRVEPFRYIDPGIMATVGRRRGVALLEGRQYTGTRGWLIWLYHHLMRIVDLQNRALVLARWSWAYLTWKWGVRLVYDRNPTRELSAPPEEFPER